MNGKLVILIVIVTTLAGIALAWYFLNTLPTNTQDQSFIETTVIYTNNWLSSYNFLIK